MSVIEIMTFRLDPAVDEGAFLDADKRVQTEFAYQQPGLLRRTTARGASGEWIVIDLWRSVDDADACTQLWNRDEAATAFMSLVDEATVSTSRYSDLD